MSLARKLAEDATVLTWKPGDPADTARVARETGIPLARLQDMARNFTTYRPHGEPVQ